MTTKVEGIFSGLDSIHSFNVTNSSFELDTIHSKILELYQTNRKLEGWYFYLITLSYAILILVGTIGNSCVIYIISAKPTMRTDRNIYILNLAISDIMLCLITIPMTLMEILSRYWPLGDTAFLCKLVGTLEAINIFVSTFSITAIALDRYNVIVYPTKSSLHRFGPPLTILGIWVLSVVLVLPMYLYRRLDIINDKNLKQIGLDSLAFCLEDWPTPYGSVLYSVFVLIIQYVLPVVIVSISYSRICRKLRRRRKSAIGIRKGSELAGLSNRREERRKKTNSLFIAIALIFCISWLPLNLCNLIFDIENPFQDDSQTTIIIFATCHLIGMSSACSNPFLYGWFNDNFRRQFKGILLFRLFRRRRRKTGFDFSDPNIKEGHSIVQTTIRTELTSKERKIYEKHDREKLVKLTENREIKSSGPIVVQ